MRTYWKSSGWLLGIVLLTCGPTPMARATPAMGPRPGARIYVLPPSATEALRKAFAKAEPGVRLQSARIERDRARLRVCAGQVCSQLVLSPPMVGCAGYPAGAWCVSEVSPGPDAKVRAVVKRVLASIPRAAAWRESRVPGNTMTAPPAPKAAPRRSSGQDTSTYWWLLAGLVATFLAVWGLLVARRRYRQRS